MVTVFMLLRSLGSNLQIAYAGQAVAAIGAVGATWYIWSVKQNVDDTARLAVMFCLVVLATPYAYLYDLPGLAMVLLAYTARMKWRPLIPLTLFWIVTSLYILISMVSFVAGAFFVLMLAIYIWSKMIVHNGRTL